MNNAISRMVPSFIGRFVDEFTDGQTDGGNDDIFHVILLGQSKALGVDSHHASDSIYPTILPAPTFSNQAPSMPDTGLRSGSAATALVPLVETLEPGPGSQNVGETLCTGIALGLQDTNLRVVYSVSALNGGRYGSIQQGSATHTDMLNTVNAIKTLADAEGVGYRVLCAVVMHGETDQSTRQPDYDTNIIQWQIDVDTDVKAITGQSQGIPFFMTQPTTSLPSDNLIYPDFATSYKMIDAHRAAPSAIIPVTQTSWLAGRQVISANNFHFSPHAQRYLGYIVGRAVKNRLVDGQNWAPVTCTSATLSGTQITATFSVPFPPLEFDFENVMKNVIGNQFCGFTYIDDVDSIPIVGAVVQNDNQVVFALSTTPTGGNRRLRAGHGQDLTSGPIAGDGRINLRDQGDGSTVPALGSARHYNWCTQFEIEVT